MLALMGEKFKFQVLMPDLERSRKQEIKEETKQERKFLSIL